MNSKSPLMYVADQQSKYEEKKNKVSKFMIVFIDDWLSGDVFRELDVEYCAVLLEVCCK